MTVASEGLWALNVVTATEALLGPPCLDQDNWEEAWKGNTPVTGDGVRPRNSRPTRPASSQIL